eukprot:163926_1
MENENGLSNTDLSISTLNASNGLTECARAMYKQQVIELLDGGVDAGRLCAALCEIIEEFPGTNDSGGEECLQNTEPNENRLSMKSEGEQIRYYVDGCFDLMHSGHYNALRQAKALGGIVIAGVHSCEEILKHKGPPVLTDEERLAVVKSCKWVDEVVFGTPYCPTVKLLDELNADFYVHGDDIPVAPDGSSSTAEVAKAGRLKLINRTSGVSTTDMVGRLLLMTKSHHVTVYGEQSLQPNSTFLATSSRIAQFSNKRHATSSDVVIYVDGSFDLFHAGQIETLKRARELGTFLIVGLHDDATVNAHRGKNYPIQTLHERALNVLACKHVDEVVMGAPWCVTVDLVRSLHISKVVSGSNTKFTNPNDSLSDPYVYPKESGMFRTVPTTSNLSTDVISSRIIAHRCDYEKRQRKCVPKEDAYVAQKIQTCSLSETGDQTF